MLQLGHRSIGLDEGIVGYGMTAVIEGIGGQRQIERYSSRVEGVAGDGHAGNVAAIWAYENSRVGLPSHAMIQLLPTIRCSEVLDLDKIISNEGPCSANADLPAIHVAADLQAPRSQ